MRRFFLLLILIYQSFFSLLLKQLLGVSRMCRFAPTCSDYAKLALREKGVVKGGFSVLLRLFQCHPFARLDN